MFDLNKKLQRRKDHCSCFLKMCRLKLSFNVNKENIYKKIPTSVHRRNPDHVTTATIFSDLISINYQTIRNGTEGLSVNRSDQTASGFSPVLVLGPADSRKVDSESQKTRLKISPCNRDLSAAVTNFVEFSLNVLQDREQTAAIGLCVRAVLTRDFPGLVFHRENFFPCSPPFEVDRGFS